MCHPLTVLALAGASLSLVSCSTQPRRVRPGVDAPVVLDGDVGEWSPGVVASGDAGWIYLRFRVEGAHQTLQASDETLAILLDTDADAATGRRLDSPAPASTLGTDLRVELSSPDRATGAPGVGVRVIRGDTGAEAPHASTGFSFAPTYASDWYEARLSRAGLAGMGIPSSSAIRGLLVLSDASGALLGWSDPFEAALPPAAPARPLADIDLPAKPASAIRVVSWNVLRGTPMTNPGPFARVLRVLDPDVVLVQEWTAEPADVERWFNAALPLPDGEAWEVRATMGWGVAVVSRHPIEPLGHDELRIDGSDAPVRMAGALVQTPLGVAAVASVHLKCCGSSGSEEDQVRLRESGEINRSLREALSIEPVRVRLAAGDMNLVGSRPPLDALASGLDSDGSDLTPADARVLGDASYSTWRDDASPFTPGRLDWALVGDDGASVVRAFVLDTGALADSALARAGLDRGDTEASDHKPLVVDLRPR